MATSTLLFAHGDLHERIGQVSVQVATNANNAALWFQLGDLRRMHEDWDAALEAFNRAAELDPDLALVDYARGRTLQEAGRPETALAALDKFLVAQPQHVEALRTRAQTFMDLNRPADAATDYSRVIALAQSPLPEDYLNRSRTHVAAGDIAEAVAGLDEGLKRLGAVPGLQHAVLDLELARRDFDAALARVDKFAFAAGAKETWLVRRAEILEQAGRPADARQACTNALAAIARLPELRRGSVTVTRLESKVHAVLAQATNVVAVVQTTEIKLEN